MPMKAALPPAAWSWAGFYIGAHGGYGWGRHDFGEVVSLTPLQTLGDIDFRGWVAGGQAGYNWQYGRWVAGFEVDGSATRICGESTPFVQNLGGGVTTTDIVSDDVKYLGTVRTRVGGAVPFANTDVLLYGTAGLAWERLHRTETNAIVVPPISQTSPLWHREIISAGLPAPALNSVLAPQAGSGVSNTCTTISARSKQTTSVVTNFAGQSFADRAAGKPSTSCAAACPTSSIPLPRPCRPTPPACP